MKAPKTVADLCKAYLAEQRELLRLDDPLALQPMTVRKYERALGQRIIPMFGQMRLTAFKPSHVAQFLAAERKAGRPVLANRDAAALGSAFNFGMQMGWVETNPCYGVRRNRERPRTERPTIEQVNNLWAVAEQEGGAALMCTLIAMTVALTGRRRAEILNLPRSAITDQGIKMEDTKTRRWGTRNYLVQWSPVLRRVIEKAQQLRPDTPWLFPTRFGRPYTDPGFTTVWYRDVMEPYQAIYGHRIRPHDLRAFYVTEMLTRGESPNTHRNESTMRRVYDRRRVVTVKPLA